MVPSPNLLLIGPEAAVDGCLARLMPSFAAPVVWCHAANFQLPDSTMGSAAPSGAAPGTVVLEDVSALTSSDQARLLAWLDDPGRARLVATASRSIFPLVTSGQFSDVLYYRINTVTLKARFTGFTRFAGFTGFGVHRVQGVHTVRGSLASREPENLEP